MPQTGPKASDRGETSMRRLDALDRAVFARRYGDRLLLAMSGVGLVILALMIVGLLIGNNGFYALPEVGLGLFVVPLVEVWSRRSARGRAVLEWFARLDERVLGRR